jgi:hypothetical protein
VKVMPKEFVNLPTLRPPKGRTGDEELWEVSEPWVSPAFDGYRLAFRAGFLTDGASIPRPFWVTIGHPFHWPTLGPALCHDALYAAEYVTRAHADWLFVGWLESVGTTWAKRNRMWLAVRAGGWVPWGRHTPESIAAARRCVRLIQADASEVIWPVDGGIEEEMA